LNKNSHGILQSNPTLITLLHRCLDSFVIVVSLLFWVLYTGNSWSLEHSASSAIVLLFFHFSSEVNQLYISWRGLSLLREVKKTVVNWVISSGLLFISFNFLTLNQYFSETLELQWFATTILVLISYRIMLRKLLSKMRSKGLNTRTFVVVGAGQLGRRLVDNVVLNPSLGMDFKGYYDDLDYDATGKKINALGNLDVLISDAKAGVMDRIYITLPMRAEKRIKWLMTELADTTVSVYLVPDIFMFELLHARTDIIIGIPTISIYDSPMDGSNAFIKRVEDLILASCILVLISPVLLILSFMVKVTSKGPVLFKQTRYGIDGCPINVWKFRSMTVLENDHTVTQARKNDQRFTPIGRFIRQTSLDELPQFINVLQGNMSVVGPRPHATIHNEQYRKTIKGYMLRHKVKPGITGWAQINGWRGETQTLNKMKRRIEFDLEYIRNWSLIFDLKIVVLTVFRGFTNKNGY